MLEFPGEGVNLRKSAVFCDNLLPALPEKLVGEFLNIFGREIWWEIRRECRRIFPDAQNKGSKISGKFSEHFL